MLHNLYIFMYIQETATIWYKFLTQCTQYWKFGGMGGLDGKEQSDLSFSNRGCSVVLCKHWYLCIWIQQVTCFYLFIEGWKPSLFPVPQSCGTLSTTHCWTFSSTPVLPTARYSCQDLIYKFQGNLHLITCIACTYLISCAVVIEFVLDLMNFFSWFSSILILRYIR